MNRAQRRRNERLAKTSAASFDVGPVLERGLENHRSGLLAEARQAYEEVLHRDAKNARALFLLGTLAVQEQDFKAAETLIRQAMEEDPEESSYLNNLGVILRETQRPLEAVESYREAIRLSPDYAEAYCNLGIALKELGRTEEAISPLERAVDLAPDFGGAYSNLGNALHVLGRSVSAMSAFDKAVTLSPRDPSAYFNRAIAQQDYGNLGAARADYREVLRLQPQHGEAWRLLSGLKRFTSAEDEDIETMSRMVRTGTITESNSMHMHFGLGKALADVDETESAFRSIAKANAIYRGTYEYDIEKDAEYFESIKRIFSNGFLSDREGWGCKSERPIFIVGMMRSGTSLVEQILASHPLVVGCGESKEVDRLTRKDEAKPSGLDYPESVLAFDHARATQLGEDYLHALDHHAGTARRTIDKMPGNFQYVGLIRLLLPGATIIHCVRNPVDTCLSCFRNYFAGFHPFSYDLAELGQYYRLYLGLMDHWQEVASDQLHEICYEELVSDPEAQILRLLKICGLDWDDRCLEFHQTERPVRTASAAQIRRPIYTSSVESWRKYEVHLGPLLEALK